MKLKPLSVGSVLVLLVVTAACEKTSPTAPASAAGATVGATTAGESPVTDASTGVTIGAPQLVSPAANKQFRFVEQPVTLTISNGVTTGSVPLTYTFEVATDASFASKVYTKDVAQGGNGQTSQTIDKLGGARIYFWRARSNSGTAVGPNSGSRSFEIGPEVVLQAPVLANPGQGATVTGTQVTLTTNNVARSGPAGQVFYRFEVAGSAAFNPVTAATTIAEQPGSQTSVTLPSSGSTASTTVFWRVQASDPSNGVTTAFSPTASFQHVPFDLRNATILDSPDDFSGWPETATITALDMLPIGINVEFTKKHGPDRWPDIIPPGFAGPIQYCLGMAWNIAGHWYASAPIEMWNDRPYGGGPPEEYALNWFYNPIRWAPMTFNQPNPGDTIGFFVTAGDTRGFNSNQKYQERSNVVLIPMPDRGGASYRFSSATAQSITLRSKR
jgi:hypothetical protein